MGKLVLTRRAGESVKLTEPNGIVWLVTLDRNSPFFHKAVLRLQNGKAFTKHELWYGNAMTFAGGNVELRPHKRPA